MGSVEKTTNLTGTTNQVSVREDSLLHGDCLQRHQFRLLVVHADHVVELTSRTIERDPHRNGDRHLLNEIRNPLQRHATQRIARQLHLHQASIAVNGAVPTRNQVRLSAVDVLQQRHLSIRRRVIAFRDSEQLSVVALLPHPRRRPPVREHHIRRLHPTRHHIRRRERLQRVPQIPHRATRLPIPPNYRRSHRVADQMTATLPHLQPETIHLPPALDRPRRVQRVPITRPVPRPRSRKRHRRSHTRHPASHLIQTLRQQVRHRRHRVLLHVRQRNLKRAVVDRLDGLHLRVQRAIMPRALTPQMDNVVYRLHAIPLRA